MGLAPLQLLVCAEQQDVEFPINQLVEIAIRAISPAVNDPFTAIRCIDRLSVGLSHLAERDFPSPYRYDDDKNLRVIAEVVTFADLSDAAFNQIRQYSTSDVGVRIRLLEAIAIIATRTHRQKDRVALLHHAKMIQQVSPESVPQECEPERASPFGASQVHSRAISGGSEGVRAVSNGECSN